SPTPPCQLRRRSTKTLCGKRFHEQALTAVAILTAGSVVMLEVGPERAPRLARVAADDDHAALLLVVDADAVVEPGAQPAGPEQVLPAVRPAEADEDHHRGAVRRAG